VGSCISDRLFSRNLCIVFLAQAPYGGPAFLTSALSLYAMICSAAAGLYPYVLPASNPQHGLTIYRAASASESMTLALLWWIPGMVLVGIYTYFVYGKILPTRLSLAHEEH